ncbi:MAG TPA: hypothetical protein VK530_19665, partial [Candidatus Acidoferrum sp.]|nr:hypothetical protein [Candidatus Acidoferrum sp.]
DETASVAAQLGAEVVQFRYTGGYPKKRQWALENLQFQTPWVLLIDADEVVPPQLWDEIAAAIAAPGAHAFLIRKGFHFLGRRFRFGGFSHEAVLLFRYGSARFERLLDQDASGFDMEVHERVIVDGRIDRLRTPLIHEDFKGLEAYRARHRQYAIWEAKVRHNFLTTGSYGEETIAPKLFGNAQERRRLLKKLIIRLPFEPLIWFLSHYLVHGACLEGRAGFTASLLRAQYIADVRQRLKVLRESGRGDLERVQV